MEVEAIVTTATHEVKEQERTSAKKKPKAPKKPKRKKKA